MFLCLNLAFIQGLQFLGNDVPLFTSQHDTNLMLVECWSTVAGAGPASNQQPARSFDPMLG